MGEYKQIGHIFLHEENIVLQCQCCLAFYNEIQLLRQHLKQLQIKEEESDYENIEILEEYELAGLDELPNEQDELLQINKAYEETDDHDNQFEDNILKEEEMEDNFQELDMKQHYLEHSSSEIINKTDEVGMKPDEQSLQQALRNLRELRMAKSLKQRSKRNKKPLMIFPSKCEHCDFIADNRTRYSAHMDGKHLTNECPICGVKIKWKSNLSAHIRQHTQPKRFSCSYCDLRFHTGVSLKIHERSHTGEKPYLCNKCGKSFSTSGRLTMHQKHESNERPFACELCDKRFKTKAMLKDHMVGHTGEKNIACEYCESRFARRKSYLLHLKLHVDAKEYRCELCPMAFNQKAALYSHMKTYHKQKLSAKTTNV